MPPRVTQSPVQSRAASARLLTKRAHQSQRSRRWVALGDACAIGSAGQAQGAELGEGAVGGRRAPRRAGGRGPPARVERNAARVHHGAIAKRGEDAWQLILA